MDTTAFRIEKTLRADLDTRELKTSITRATQT
jgi:hypothetical protein